MKLRRLDGAGFINLLSADMGDKEGTLWLPPQASSMAAEMDWVFYFVYWTSVIIFLGVVLTMAYFVIRYRRKKGDGVPAHVEESRLLEASWIVIPTILCMIVFTWGFQGFVKMSVAPPDAYEVRAVAQQFRWEFTYDTGMVSQGELHVPANRPVKVIMNSTDVLHSFFVPDFRVKHDVLPNRYTSVWFEAMYPGEFQIYCTEYCGTSHSGMLAKVIVHEEEDFQAWLQEGDDNLPLPELGAKRYTGLVCNQCHSLDGTPGVGPSFTGLYGSERPLADGTTVTADDNYIRESILDPMAKISQGFAPAMPASFGGLSEREISGLIEFIKAQQ